MVSPKKHLGQHFLKNDAIALRIAEALSGSGYSNVLEIGPGTGVLTQFLIKKEQPLTVVELDRESVSYLKKEQKLAENQIIGGDFLQLNLNDFFIENIAIIGNFPYNISTQIIFKILEHKILVKEMVGMFQKEVAERIVASPGGKTRGILSVLTEAFYEREYLFTVNKSEFNPPAQGAERRHQNASQRKCGTGLRRKTVFQSGKNRFWPTQKNPSQRAETAGFAATFGGRKNPRPTRGTAWLAGFCAYHQKNGRAMNFEITDGFTDQLEDDIKAGNLARRLDELNEMHPADLAEVIDSLPLDEAKTLVEHLEEELAADALVELDEDLRGKILQGYSGKEIAMELVENLDSDDAVDIINELSPEKKREVLNHIEDREQGQESRGIADVFGKYRRRADGHRTYQSEPQLDGDAVRKRNAPCKPKKWRKCTTCT